MSGDLKDLQQRMDSLKAVGGPSRLAAVAGLVLDRAALAKLDSADLRAIMEAVILADDPAAKFDGRTDTYVETRFNLIAEKLNGIPDREATPEDRQDSQGRRVQRQDNGDAGQDSGEHPSVDLTKRRQDAWKANKEGKAHVQAPPPRPTVDAGEHPSVGLAKKRKDAWKANKGP